VHYVSTLGLFLSFCLGTLYTYSLTVHSDHISLYKLDLSHLCIIITNYCDMYFTVETQSVLCLLLSNNKFYIHSGGSLEY